MLFWKIVVSVVVGQVVVVEHFVVVVVVLLTHNHLVDFGNTRESDLKLQTNRVHPFT